MSRRLVRPPSPLRRSLSASIAEGVVAELILATVGHTAMMAWALHLGARPAIVALLGALPFLAQAMQVPGAWLNARLGARAVTLISVAVSRQAFLPLVLFPFLPLENATKATVLVICACVHHASGIVCNNGWVTWMGALVPSRVRGRYFGRRTAITTLAAAAATFAGGLVVDLGRGARVLESVLAALALIASVAGLVSTWLMTRKHDPEQGQPRLPFALERFLRPLRDGDARSLLIYLALWNAALGLAVPFFALFVARDLGLGFTAVAALGGVAAVVRMLTAPRFGRHLDRVGARPLVVQASAWLALSPLLWLAADTGRWWPLALEAVLAAVLFSAHGLAAFALPLAVMPRRERPYFHAAFAVTGGLAYGLATLGGGWLLERAPTALPSLFVASAVLRLTAAVVARRVGAGAAPLARAPATPVLAAAASPAAVRSTPA